MWHLLCCAAGGGCSCEAANGDDGSCRVHAQRFNLMATTSYAALDPGWKAHLARLHDDYLEGRQVGPRAGVPRIFEGFLTLL